MTQEQQKLERGEYIQKVIKTYMQTEPKLELPELAYLLWELSDFGIFSAEKLVKEIIKCVKSKY